MNCREIQRKLSAYQDNELEKQQVLEIQDHLGIRVVPDGIGVGVTQRGNRGRVCDSLQVQYHGFVAIQEPIAVCVGAIVVRIVRRGQGIRVLVVRIVPLVKGD